MSGIITSSSFAKALWPGVNKWYGIGYKEYNPEYVDLFDKNTSQKAYEEDVGFSSFGLAAQKAEGAAITYDTQRQGFTTRYNHVVYALGFVITREIYEDDQYSVVGKKKATALARSMRITKEIIGANVYNRAFNSAYAGGDGIMLLNSAHLNIAGGTYSNVLAADLSEAALEQATTDIEGFTDDRGLIIAARPVSLIIPRWLRFEAHRILKSDGRTGTDLNDPNALKEQGLYNKIVINHYLTDQDAWFIRTDVSDGMKYFERRSDQFEMDNDFDTENAKFKATGRYSFGWSDPRGLYGSAGV